MRPVNRKMQNILERLIDGLAVGEARKLESEGFMPLCVERIDDAFFSVAHYGEQNGDAMRDPDVVFWRGCAGPAGALPDAFYPISYRNDYLGKDSTYVRFEDGKPSHLARAAQRDLASFCGTWASNIVAQGYKIPGKPPARAKVERWTVPATAEQIAELKAAGVRRL